jgi:demethylmenaquinone methyltransferase / 2-methoxy-6-polyprenyl-1,4-benzoquinol methylase
VERLLKEVPLFLSSFALREKLREQQFGSIWTRDLNDVFADVAPYYDRANHVASLGLWNWFLSRYMSIIEARPGERVLDVCAGTNAVGIALLEREPGLEVDAIDRSAAMQEIGMQRAQARGLRIHSVIGDVHELPFPDNHYDIVTLQYASRHLRIKRVFEEIHRVLKPGGRFYHCDMLRPVNPAVEVLYYAYLRFCLNLTAFLFQSGPVALNCKEYFINALQMFYSADELSGMLRDVGYLDVGAETIFAGMIGFHRATRAM